MKALIYEGPYQMHVRDVPLPGLQPDEVLIRVAYSGICGSELSGYEGKNALRKPPLIMGHEFTGAVEAIGETAERMAPKLEVGDRVTVNPLITCGECVYCRSERHQLCATRRLHSAHLPGSNAQFIAVRADAVIPLPGDLSLKQGALAEPAACGVHAARIGMAQAGETALVAGAGPIGLLAIQALRNRGVETIYCVDLNAERRAMAASEGAIVVEASDDALRQNADLAVDAVGLAATRQLCQSATRSGGRVVWVGLHESHSALDVNDAIRREITSIGSFGYSRGDFLDAVDALAQGRMGLPDAWTRVEPLANGAACFEELLQGSSVAKIWLTIEQN